MASPTPCAPGSYCASTGLTSATGLCAPGTFSSAGSAVCLTCPPGMRQSAAGQAGCTPCAFGSFASAPDAAACTPCSMRAPLSPSALSAWDAGGSSSVGFGDGGNDDGGSVCLYGGAAPVPLAQLERVDRRPALRNVNPFALAARADALALNALQVCFLGDVHGRDRCRLV
jgi:hypothetical protein